MDWEKELESFKLFPHPRKSSSKNSRSLYLGIKKLKDRALILQYLPKNSKTSLHYHKNLKEKHSILAGRCYILKGDKLSSLKQGKIINIKEVHRLETKGQGCLILLEVIHNGNINWAKDKYEVKN